MHWSSLEINRRFDSASMPDGWRNIAIAVINRESKQFSCRSPVLSLDFVQLSMGQQLSSAHEASQRPNQCANADR
jgi:hypothetical protein